LGLIDYYYVAYPCCRELIKIELAKYGRADFSSIENGISTTSTMQHPPLVSVIIVTWNSNKYLHICLDKLSIQTINDFEIILVDNGSEDNALDGLQEKYPSLDLHIHRLSSNLGFAAANNIGARLARGRWLVLLNADAFPEPNWLEKLIAATESHPEMASFSSRQLQANNPEFLDGVGDAYHVSGLAWRIGLGYPAGQYGLKAAEIFSPCAAAAMYLHEAFLDVGGFDEDFFSYFEDVDLGFRLQLKGYRSLYAPEAVVHHIGSATFGGRSDFAFYHSHRNLIWTFVKNMPTALFWRYLPAHILANLIYVSYYTLRGRGRVLWQAKHDAIKDLSKFIHKRRAIQKEIRITSSELSRLMENGWFQPYLLEYHLRRARRSIKPPTDVNE
jgi:GT2 family glycosyltransferase